MTMKKILLVSLFALCNVAFVNADAVCITIVTSCGYVHVVNEIGDNVTEEQWEAYKAYIEWVYCGD